MRIFFKHKVASQLFTDQYGADPARFKAAMGGRAPRSSGAQKYAGVWGELARGVTGV